MTTKVKIITENNTSALEESINKFLKDELYESDEVKDIKYSVDTDSNGYQEHFALIIYKES